MDIDYTIQEPLEGFVNQDENAIERSLELLLADLGGSNGSLPVDEDMNLEAPPTLPNEEVTMQDAGTMGDEVEEREKESEEAIPRIEGDILDQSMSPATPAYRVKVVIPEILPEERAEYSFVHSDIVESVLEEVLNDDLNAEYRVEFTDGREELVGGHSLIFIQRAANLPALCSCGDILSPHLSATGLLFRSSALRHRSVNTLAIVNGLPYSLPTSQIYTPLLCSPAPLLIPSRHFLALLPFFPLESFKKHMHLLLLLATNH